MYDEDHVDITKEVLSHMKMAKIFKDCVCASPNYDNFI
jgi:hypothetical protein